MIPRDRLAGENVHQGRRRPANAEGADSLLPLSYVSVFSGPRESLARDLFLCQIRCTLSLARRVSPFPLFLDGKENLGLFLRLGFFSISLRPRWREYGSPGCRARGGSRRRYDFQRTEIRGTEPASGRDWFARDSVRRILFFLLRNALLASAAALSRGRLAERVTFVTSCPVNDDRGSSSLIRRRPTRARERLDHCDASEYFSPVPRDGEKRPRPRGPSNPLPPLQLQPRRAGEGSTGYASKDVTGFARACAGTRARTLSRKPISGATAAILPRGLRGPRGLLLASRVASRESRASSWRTRLPNPYENRLGGSRLRFPALSQPRLSSAPLYLYDPF